MKLKQGLVVSTDRLL